MRFLLGTSGLVATKKLKKGSPHQVVEGTWAFHSAGTPSPSEAPLRRGEPHAASMTPSGSRAGPGNGPEVMRPGCAGEGGDPAATEASSLRGPPFLSQDALWLQEVSNLSEWLSPSP